MTTVTGKTACRKYEALLEDYLSGELTAADAKRAAEHWKNCAACREALEQAAASARLLRAGVPTPDAGPGFARAVMARIRSAEQDLVTERAGFWQPFVSVGWRFAATATLALGVLVTYGAQRGVRSQPIVAAVRPTIVHDLFSPELAGAPTSDDDVLTTVAETTHGNN
ncbi:MAG TPA: zf-HC2 domain-containing protein [Candidatus Acidoferrales bacterium]|nr:zf-HC2 domain-containing protein [Candidatus Acidoferrales bacterium]